MARKIYVNLTVRLIIDADDVMTVDEVIQNMDYDFVSQTKNTKIVKTEILEHEVIDVKE